MTQMSDDKKDRLLAAFSEGMTTAEAAARVGVCSRTVERWAAADPDFASAVADAKDRADDSVEAVTYRNCIDPDPAHNILRMFWLKSRRPAVYGDRLRQEITGAGGGPVEFMTNVERIYGDKPGG
jgi:hypothetical protein